MKESPICTLKCTQGSDRMCNGKEDCWLSVKSVNKWARASYILLDDKNEMRKKGGIINNWSFLLCFTCAHLKLNTAKSFQSCPTLCDPIDGSLPGSSFPGILQARTLEWVAISFSNAWKWKVKVKSLSRVWLFTTPWTAAYQAPPSMGVSRQEYWS